MKILHGQQLANELRKLSETVQKRLWIAVPYIGSPTTIRKILGKHWFDNPSVSVRLLTDTSDLTCVNLETIQSFYERGLIKCLAGLHAKIYIVDDTCLISSANLTHTAFTKRHEIGMLFNSTQAGKVIDTFEAWWKKSDNANPSKLKKTPSQKRHQKDEPTGNTLPSIFTLPSDPGTFTTNLETKFLNYDRLVAEYEDFADKYASIQRIWKNKPLYFEIDGLFNYLYHEAPKTPSLYFANKPPRQLSPEKQLTEIKNWANRYKKWNETHRKGNDIKWRVYHSQRLKKLFAKGNIQKLTKEELSEALNYLNSLRSYQINRSKILNGKNNSLKDIRQGLNQLVHGTGQLASRMTACNEIRYLGPSSMNEILGFTNPGKYPLINKNSNCGLRFFGYNVKVYG